MVKIGTIGDSGVTDANGDGIVDLTDIQAFINARLDADGQAFFTSEGITLLLFLRRYSEQLAALRLVFLHL